MLSEGPKWQEKAPSRANPRLSLAPRDIAHKKAPPSPRQVFLRVNRLRQREIWEYTPARPISFRLSVPKWSEKGSRRELSRPLFKLSFALGGDSVPRLSHHEDGSLVIWIGEFCGEQPATFSIFAVLLHCSHGIPVSRRNCKGFRSRALRHLTYQKSRAVWKRTRLRGPTRQAKDRACRGNYKIRHNCTKHGVLELTKCAAIECRKGRSHQCRLSGPRPHSNGRADDGRWSDRRTQCHVKRRCPSGGLIALTRLPTLCFGSAARPPAWLPRRRKRRSRTPRM